MKKAIIFDSSTLISLSMAGLLPELKELKKIFKGSFILTSDVKREIIDKPLTIKKFELDALRLKAMLDEKVFETPTSIGINEEELAKKTEEILNIANSTFIGRGREIKLIDSGEASCLALGKILNEKKISNVLAIDERTAKMLGEKPANLQKLLQGKLHTDVTYKKENFKFFEGLNSVRSAELIYVAYKKGVVRLKDGPVLDALLWAVKFKGCSISSDEIKEIQRIK